MVSWRPTSPSWWGLSLQTRDILREISGGSFSLLGQCCPWSPPRGRSSRPLLACGSSGLLCSLGCLLLVSRTCNGGLLDTVGLLLHRSGRTWILRGRDQRLTC